MDELLSLSQPPDDAELYDDGTDIIDMPEVLPSSRPSAGVARAPNVEEPPRTDPAGAPTLEDVEIEELDAELVEASVIEESGDTLDDEDDIEDERQSLLSDVLEPEADDSEAALVSQRLAEEIKAGLESRDSRELLLEELERQAVERAQLAVKSDESEDEPTHKLRVDTVAKQRARDSESLADELAPSLARGADVVDELRPSLADDLEPDEEPAPKRLKDLAKAVGVRATPAPKGSIDWDDDAEGPASGSVRPRRSKVPLSPSPRAASRSSRAPVATTKSKAPTSRSFAEQSPSEPPTTPDLLGMSLDRVRGLQDLPPESQQALSLNARIETLGKDEELNGFAVALVLKGAVKIMPAIADAVCAHASVGDVVFTEGHLADGVMLRAVADADDTRLAFWDAKTLAEQIANCPWVDDDLRAIADRFQALAGAAMGSLGERLDDGLRAMVTDRCEVLALKPGEALLEQGETVNGMYVVGGGHIELLDGERVTEELYPGEFLFAAQVMAGGGAPRTVRASSSGALLLRADRMVAHELLVSVPPLLEILAG